MAPAAEPCVSSPCRGLPPFLKAGDLDIAWGDTSYSLCLLRAFGKLSLLSAFTPETCPCAYCMSGKRFIFFWSAESWRSAAKHCVVRRGTKPKILQTSRESLGREKQECGNPACSSLKTGWRGELMQGVKQMYSCSKKEAESGCQKAVQPLRLMPRCREWCLAHKHPAVLQCGGSRLWLYSLGWLAGFCAVSMGDWQNIASAADLTVQGALLRAGELLHIFFSQVKAWECCISSLTLQHLHTIWVDEHMLLRSYIYLRVA